MTKTNICTNFFQEEKKLADFWRIIKKLAPSVECGHFTQYWEPINNCVVKGSDEFFFFSCTVLLHTSVNSVAFNCTTVAPLSSNHDYDCFQRYVLLNWMFFSIYLMTIQLQMRGFVSLPATELMITLKLTFTYTCLVLKCLTRWYFEDT